MKLTSNRIDIDAPREVQQAMFVIGHWLASIEAADLDGSFNVTENRESNEDAEIVTYQVTMKQIKRHKWLIEGQE